ncbi:MAG: 16S rRNA (cytosine(1402)-N(4))-methyltransferase RsmH [Alphaproteobacteria bacterium]|nr:16S rRNA (cytosine(1402)-N(4))-methyltransferase RsmH [Alphaproteobacteria bacterium]
MTEASGHRPVMLEEVLSALAPAAGAEFVDGTLGAGGLSEALLVAAPCRVWAIDRDPDAVARGAELMRRYPDRLAVIAGRFSMMDRLLASRDVATVDGVALDLGVSSLQLDDPERGFSFQSDGPLDMRMEREGRTAADVVNTANVAELATILRRYGEEPRALAVARAIVAARSVQPLTRTGELAALVAETIGQHGRRHPATRTFQALRIYVNREVGDPESELDRGLAAAERLLKPGGRLTVISFHSLEDRTVKRFLVERSTVRTPTSRHALPAVAAPAPTFRRSGKAIRPRPEEIAANPRARSARLRVAVRTAAAAPLAEAAA